MFNKKKKQPEQHDRLGRQRQPRTGQPARNAAVFSYHANRAVRPGATGRADTQPAVPSPASQRSKKAGISRLLQYKPVVAGLAAVLVLVVGNLYLGGQPHVVIEVPKDSPSADVPLRSAAAYEDVARKHLSGSLRNKNKLTIDAAGVEAAMLAQFPELSRADVHVPFIGTGATVRATPVQPRLLLNAGAVLYVLDSNGRALIQASQVPHLEKLGLPVVLDQSGLPVSVGKPALPRGNVAFITEVVGQLEAKGLSVTSIILPAGASQMDIKLAGAGYTVRFNLQGNGRVQAGTYLAVREQLAREKKVPSSYVDVRVEDRAYYK